MVVAVADGNRARECRPDRRSREEGRNFRVGDVITRVGTPASPDGKISVTWGGFAEIGIAVDHWAMAEDGLPPGEWEPHRRNQIMPAAIDPRVGPMFITWRETMSTIQRMGVGEGANILIVGSGGNGLSFAAHAHNLGAARVVMVGSARLREAATAKAGVDDYLDYREKELTDALKDLIGDGFDFIIDAVGQVGVADRVIPSLKAGGKYCTYGVDNYGKVSINPTLARGSFTVHAAKYDEAEAHQTISEMVLQGKLDATLWYDLDKTYPLDKIHQAYHDVIKERKSVKALIDLNGKG